MSCAQTHQHTLQHHVQALLTADGSYPIWNKKHIHSHAPVNIQRAYTWKLLHIHNFEKHSNTFYVYVIFGISCDM